jgi:protein-tyrosine phosphatase
MPPIVIDIRNAEDARDVVHRAVQALAEGQLVALPTETVYGLAASACRADAVERLIRAKGRSSSQPFALGIKSAEEAPDFVPDLSPLARRLARRCWPGPVTLVVDNQHKEGLTQQLPPAVRNIVTPNGTVGLRVPANEMSQDVLRMLSGPIVLTSANRSGAADSVTAQEVVDAIGEDVALVLDDGPCRYGQPSTVVRVTKNRFEVLREGVVGEATIRRNAGVMVLFVCTGNTCRSPMAELLMRARLAECLKCTLEDLEERGVVVMSAGIAAAPG